MENLSQLYSQRAALGFALNHGPTPTTGQVQAYHEFCEYLRLRERDYLAAQRAPAYAYAWCSICGDNATLVDETSLCDACFRLTTEAVAPAISVAVCEECHSVRAPDALHATLCTSCYDASRSYNTIYDGGQS